MHWKFALWRVVNAEASYVIIVGACCLTDGERRPLVPTPVQSQLHCKAPGRFFSGFMRGPRAGNSGDSLLFLRDGLSAAPSALAGAFGWASRSTSYGPSQERVQKRKGPFAVNVDEEASAPLEFGRWRASSAA
eukprot:scaffold1098_cov417-Prasinococcus_capsulatus_cf.AAC.11